MSSISLSLTIWSTVLAGAIASPGIPAPMTPGATPLHAQAIVQSVGSRPGSATPGANSAAPGARSGAQTKVTLNLRSVPLQAALQAISDQSGLKLTYPDDVLPQRY